MSLVNMKKLLDKASREKYGVGAFSIADMEMIMGVVKAAEERRSPAIIQVTQARLPYSPLALIGPMMLSAAKNASVPIAVHLDHGRELSGIEEALEVGFTSVMIDASLMPIKENIAMVKKVIKMAAPYGAAVEAEVGSIGGSEGWAKNDDVRYSDPEEVRMLYEETGVDAIALSIGNAHGIYKSEPKLNFEILQKTAEIVPVPLVLHGGSGISDDDFRKCIQYGIRKVNIATASFVAVTNAVQDYYESNVKHDYFGVSNHMVEATCKNVERHMDVFGSSNREK